MPLAKPDFSARDVYLEIKKSISNNQKLKLAIDGALPDIDQLDSDYEVSASGAKLWRTISRINLNTHFTNKQLKSFYSYRMLEKENVRELYDEISLSADFQLCPFCKERTVDGVDHFLSRSKRPGFSVFPNNLVPCCDRCNKKKGNEIPTSIGAQFLHPYFEELWSFPWLQCRIRTTSPVSFEFYVGSVAGSCPITLNRLKNQFDKLKLNKMYAPKAAKQFVESLPEFSRLFRSGGRRNLLKSVEESESDIINSTGHSWKTAFYRSLAESEWFLSGQFT